MRGSRAEDHLILLSAGTAARRRALAARAHELSTEVDWRLLAEVLRLRRLLSTLGPRIVELSDGRASEDFGAAVNHAVDAGRRHSAFLQLVALRAVSMLADAGIQSVPLKGPLLGEALYGDPGRRSSSDVDLLVPPEHLSTAVEVIRELGYKSPTDYVDDRGLPLLHFMLAHERDELPPVELHWRVHWYEKRFAHERLLPRTIDSQDGWRPAPSDELAALLLFYARDGFVDLRLACDLGAWWDRYGAELQPGDIQRLVRSYPALARVIATAISVAEKVVGIPAVQAIQSVPDLGLRGRMAARLANPNPHASRAQLYADAGFIDGLLTPSGGLRAFFRRQVLLPREVYDEYAGSAPEWRAKSTLDYGARVLARYGLTAVRTMRTPEALR
jgi:Uncharacterised nucleotidyltransferase